MQNLPYSLFYQYGIGCGKKIGKLKDQEGKRKMLIKHKIPK
jgi:hypothetical protein